MTPCKNISDDEVTDEEAADSQTTSKKKPPALFQRGRREETVSKHKKINVVGPCPRLGASNIWGSLPHRRKGGSPPKPGISMVSPLTKLAESVRGATLKVKANARKQKEQIDLV